MELVERKVSRRIAQFAKVKSSNPDKAELLRFNDSLIFGAADSERDHQIMKGIEYLRVERERQRGVAARISQHKIINIGKESFELRKAF
jgi:hypothetical protein